MAKGVDEMCCILWSVNRQHQSTTTRLQLCDNPKPVVYLELINVLERTCLTLLGSSRARSTLLIGWGEL